jgi:hypothetical protein
MPITYWTLSVQRSYSEISKAMGGVEKMDTLHPTVSLMLTIIVSYLLYLFCRESLVEAPAKQTACSGYSDRRGWRHNGPMLERMK